MFIPVKRCKSWVHTRVRSQDTSAFRAVEKWATVQQTLDVLSNSLARITVMLCGGCTLCEVHPFPVWYVRMEIEPSDEAAASMRPSS
jgi:hypothetical protein